MTGGRGFAIYSLRNYTPDYEIVPLGVKEVLIKSWEGGCSVSSISSFWKGGWISTEEFQPFESKKNSNINLLQLFGQVVDDFYDCHELWIFSYLE